MPVASEAGAPEEVVAAGVDEPQAAEEPPVEEPPQEMGAAPTPDPVASETVEDRTGDAVQEPIAEGQPGPETTTEGGDPAVDDKATAEVEASPDPSAPQFIKVLVPQIVLKLHVSTGSVPEHLASSRSFYFIRSRPGKLEYDDLDTSLDLGVLGEGLSLKGLEQTLSHVFLPILMQMTGASEGAAAGGSAEGFAQLATSGMAPKHRDLLNNMQKFLSQVSQAMQQLNGDVTLPVSHEDVVQNLSLQ